MTLEGWKTYDQLAVGEPVLTLNHETGLSEWQPLEAVNVWDVVDEPMVRIKGKRHTSLTTAAHRWPVLTGRTEDRGRAWVTSGDLLTARTAPDAPVSHLEHIVLGAPHADLPTEPKYSDALVELVAWFFTEGSASLEPGRLTPKVRIGQSHTVNPDNCARIERALTSLFGPESDKLDKGGRYATPESVARRAEARRLRREHPKMSNAAIGRELGVSGQMVKRYLMEDDKTSDDVPRWRKTSGSEHLPGMTYYRLNAAAGAIILGYAPGRVVDLDFIRGLTQAQLELFIDTAVRADGSFIGGTTPLLGQKDPARLAAFELAVILSGRSPFHRQDTSDGRTANGPQERTQFLVSSSDTTVFAPQARHLSEETYTGKVWCPTTPNGTWLARQDGAVFYTGNSLWGLTAEAIRLAIEPRLATVCRALTQQWLRPILEAENVEDWDRWLVWYDSSPLRVRANRSETALQVYDRGVISDEALRRETGFDDDDAPDAPPPAREGEEDPDNPEEEQDAEEETGTDLPVDETTDTPSSLPASARTLDTRTVNPGLLAATDGVIWSALASAGRKLERTPACPRSERGRARQLPAAELHTILFVKEAEVEQYRLFDGAWTRVPEIAARYSVNEECLTAALDEYCRDLLCNGVPHAFDQTAGVLRSPCLVAAA